jgi:hypothetical protein
MLIAIGHGRQVPKGLYRPGHRRVLGLTAVDDIAGGSRRADDRRHAHAQLCAAEIVMVAVIEVGGAWLEQATSCV